MRELKKTETITEINTSYSAFAGLQEINVDNVEIITHNGNKLTMNFDEFKAMKITVGDKVTIIQQFGGSL